MNFTVFDDFGLNLEVWSKEGGSVRVIKIVLIIASIG